ncbi:MAG: hypothetical protein AAGB32_02520 [Pseudomonadota bacterium]
MFFRIICLVSMSVLLAGCATNRLANGKLDPAYSQNTVNVKALELSRENPLHVSVPQTNAVYSGGLLGAVIAAGVSASATAVSHGLRKSKSEQIYDSVDENTYNASIAQFRNTIKKAKWLKVDSLQKGTFEDLKQQRELISGFSENLDGKFAATYYNWFVIGEYYQNLTQNFHFTITPYENGKAQKPIYSVSLSSVYTPDNAQQAGPDILEQYDIWIENNNATLKKAVNVTTADINKQLAEMLSDPYVE